MSALYLPPETALAISLYRPTPESMGVGLVNFFANGDRVPAEDVVANIVLKIDQLVEVLPELLLPGPPVCVLVHATMTNGLVWATAAAWKIERAVHRQSLAAVVVSGLPYVIGTSISRLVELRLAEATAMAPTTTTVQ